MRILSFLLSVAVLLPIPSLSFAGPFGLNFKSQTPPSSCAQVQGQMYMCSPPTPHPDLDKYIMSFVKDVGICFVFGSKDVQVNSFGSQAKTLYADLIEQLTQKYGEGEDLGKLLPGSIWNEPGDFLMSLVKGERSVMYVINLKDNPDGIEKIIASTTHFRGSELAVAVNFVTTNMSRCNEAQEKKKVDAF